MSIQKQTKTTNRAHLKLVFFYILTFASLYVSIVSYLNLLFAYINIKFPDELTLSYTSSLNRIRLSTSILIVVWALYLVTQWLISKDLKNYKSLPEKSGRKLLTYLTLLLATITISVDLITLIYNFYSGGFTTPFFLKIVAVFLVTAAVFGYYRWDLSRTLNDKTKTSLIIGVIASCVLVASIVIGFFIVGSPAKQRDIRFDEQRISNLQLIQSQILDYWTRKAALPTALTDLNDSISGSAVPLDPQTKAAYTYKKTGEFTFKLCATFKTSGDYRAGSKYATPISASLSGISENWDYQSGETCFSRTIDPTLYKPVTSPTTKD